MAAEREDERCGRAYGECVVRLGSVVPAQRQAERRDHDDRKIDGRLYLYCGSPLECGLRDPSDYSHAAVDPAKDIDGVCFSIDVGRATSVTPKSGYYSTAGRGFPVRACGAVDDGGVLDSDLTPEDYQRIYGTTTEDWDDMAGEMTYQAWWHFDDDPQPLAKSGVWKGHHDTALIGLDANTPVRQFEGPGVHVFVFT